MSFFRLSFVPLGFLFACGAPPDPAPPPNTPLVTPSATIAPGTTASPNASVTPPPPVASVPSSTTPTPTPSSKAASIGPRPPTVSGKITVDAVERVVRSNYGPIRVCYETAAKSKAGLQGGVSVTFVIDGTGTVKNAVDSGSDLQSKEAIECILGEIKKLTFPHPSSGEATVLYPLSFSPGAN